MSRLALVAALVFVSLAVPAHAQREIALHARTGGELAQLCTADPREAAGLAKRNYCSGFAQGVVDTVMMHGRPFCVPPGTKRGTTLLAFARWVGAQEDRKSANAVTALTGFLSQQYPCK